MPLVKESMHGMSQCCIVYYLQLCHWCPCLMYSWREPWLLGYFMNILNKIIMWVPGSLIRHVRKKIQYGVSIGYNHGITGGRIFMFMLDKPRENMKILKLVIPMLSPIDIHTRLSIAPFYIGFTNYQINSLHTAILPTILRIHCSVSNFIACTSWLTLPSQLPMYNQLLFQLVW